MVFGDTVFLHPRAKVIDADDFTVDLGQYGLLIGRLTTSAQKGEGDKKKPTWFC